MAKLRQRRTRNLLRKSYKPWIRTAAVALIRDGTRFKRDDFEATMGRTRAALSGLACAFAVLATPASAFTAIDPLTRQPLYSANESLKAQAVGPQRQVVTFDGRYAPGTIVVSTSE